VSHNNAPIDFIGPPLAAVGPAAARGFLVLSSIKVACRALGYHCAALSAYWWVSCNTHSKGRQVSSIMDVVLRGAPTQDLTPLLGHLIWPHQAAPSTMLVTNTAQYLWYLPCNKHLRILTVQGARKQAADSFGQLSPCERCAIPYRSVGPEPQPNDVHRSYYEQVVWLQLECVLESGPIMQHMFHA
jgi:hypothetical protein